ncbi:Esa1p-associated factor [Chytriomyces hyalinus]|nr:Esa1p-associated factor [Chytriomyces hyalinus]KAJ3249916.1 Esa1p-associated factor [Chytriomyces hyalinus]
MASTTEQQTTSEIISAPAPSSGSDPVSTQAPGHQINFTEGERILCFHGPLLYEAKVLKTDFRHGKANPAENGPHYFIHYKGWKQTWDEWVPESRTLKYNDQNLKRQSDLNSLNTKKKAQQAAAAANSGDGKKTDGGAVDSKKRQRETGEKEEEYLKRPEIKIPIPESLKIQLVDDWENVTKNQKLVSLPRTPNVTQILKLFKENTLKNLANYAHQEDVLDELVNGLKSYFDKALGNILLYRFERQQYVELKKKFSDKDMSDVYGAEHLLRLFVQLPQLIAHTNMDQETILTLKDLFVEFLKYLEANASQLFLQSYENATPAYINATKNLI